MTLKSWEQSNPMSCCYCMEKHSFYHHEKREKNEITTQFLYKEFLLLQKTLKQMMENANQFPLPEFHQDCCLEQIKMEKSPMKPLDTPNTRRLSRHRMPPPHSAPSLRRRGHGIRRVNNVGTRRMSLEQSPPKKLPISIQNSPDKRSITRLTSANISKLNACNQNSNKLSKPSTTSSTVSVERSIRADVSTVSSRLYQSNYLRTREARLRLLKEQQELRECTFQPKINSKSSRTRRMKNESKLYSKDHWQTRERKLLKQKEAMESRECTFKPRINNKSSRTRRMKNESKLYSKDHWQTREQKLLKQKEAMESRECTFKPKINRSSKV